MTKQEFIKEVKTLAQTNYKHKPKHKNFSEALSWTLTSIGFGFNNYTKIPTDTEKESIEKLSTIYNLIDNPQNYLKKVQELWSPEYKGK